MKRMILVIASVLVALVVVAVVVTGFANRASAPDSIPVALVNLDEPVTSGEGDDETTIAAGRQLAAEITRGGDDESPLAWTLVDGDALDSSESKYYAVVTIPEDFSESISSLAEGDSSDVEGGDAEIVIDLENPSSPIAADIASTITTAAITTFNDDVSSTYLENLYVSYNSIGDAVGETADGAAELQSAAELLAEGGVSLASGADDLAAGANSAADAAGSVSAGANDLESGASSLAVGATSLEAALRAGSSSASSSLSPLAASSAQQSAATAAAVGALAQSCPVAAGSAYCASVAAAAATSADAAQAAGATKAASDQVVAGLSSAATSSSDLADGAAGVASGSTGVADGAAQLDDGVESVASGAAGVADGADDLAEGSADLADGAQSLSEGLVELEEAVPSYADEEDREQLADAVAAPASSRVDGTAVGGAMAFLALAVALGLWIGGTVMFIRTRAVPGWALAAGATSFRAVLLGLLPRLAIAAASAVALWLVLLVAGVTGSAAGLSLALIMVGALSTVAVLQAIFAVVGRAGHLVVGIFVLLQVAAAGVFAPIETAPPVLQAISPVLPLSTLLRALQSVVYTDPERVGAAIATLLVWGVGAVAVAALATKFSRTRLGR